MNNRIIGVGVLLLVIALPVGLYTTNNLVTSPGNPLAQMVQSQPYIDEAIVLALIGVVIIVVGLIRPPPSKGK